LSAPIKIHHSARTDLFVYLYYTIHFFFLQEVCAVVTLLYRCTNRKQSVYTAYTNTYQDSESAECGKVHILHFTALNTLFGHLA